MVATIESDMHVLNYRQYYSLARALVFQRKGNLVAKSQRQQRFKIAVPNGLPSEKSGGPQKECQTVFF